MRKRAIVLGLATLTIAFALPRVAVCQQLTVQDDAGKVTVLSRADIEALPHVKVSVAGGSSMASTPTTSTSANKVAATYEGVALKAVLEKAGAGFGESLKGKRMALCLLAEAADGYRVVLALPELDPAFTDKQIVLAYLKDGKPLDEKEGPYRVVIPDEKRMARWIRQVIKLRIVDVH
ncbi:MAG TPA: molybdopterin-dependent oxidoreductase [Terriglobales bacterium]|nr:molybdopterin-dependent oxidoreductase [Terriglobales bacterium]